MDGVVDVATSNDLKPFVDLWLMYYCEFFVGTESGPPLIASLFRKRFIIVDVTCPIAIFPIDLNLQLLKRVRDLSTGKIMDPYEALDRRHLEFLRVTHKFEYIENTAEEILDGVKEFIALFKGEWKPSAEQIKYKNAVIETGIKNRDLKFLRKWGMQGEYLGEGHICSTYLENKNFINLDNKSNEKEVSIQ
jgi:putative glycosyltransferase (TIGR04372 family)